MKKCIIVLCLINSFLVISQNELKKLNREGFIFGASIGVSQIYLNSPKAGNEDQLGLSFPNFKFGTMVNSKTAILVHLPGTIYKCNNDGRKRDRGFEGIIPSVQYWMKDNWWGLGGVGLTFDAPAFYDIKNETERKFYVGPSFLLGTGYEVWKNEKLTIDLQTRVQHGFSTLENGRRVGTAINFMIGFNFY